MQARHEYKHMLNYGDYLILRARLEKAMNKDIHADANGEYKVRSLYFDTPGDKALKEKINGVDRREKFRIRRYIGCDSIISLEKKSKIHGMCFKQSARLSNEETDLILKGETDWMAADCRELLQEFYAKIRYERLQPKTIVDYIREPFICTAGNVRITLDREIKTGLFSTDFMSDQLSTIKAGDQIVLLEVKYDQFIPDYIIRLLQLDGRKASACSKYALCRVYG